MIVRRLTIPAKNATLDGEAYLPEGPFSTTVVVCHGLPRGLPQTQNGDPGYPDLARRFAQKGYGAVIFNFRGTGASSGSLEIARWPDDLIAVLDHLDADELLGKKRYAVVGFSAGAAASICAGAKDARIDPLVACAAPAHFRFLQTEGNEQLYFDHYRNVGMIRPDYKHNARQWAQNFLDLESQRAMPSLRARRLCILHGDQDDTVPVEHAHRLAARSPAPVNPILLPGAGHQLRREAVAMKAIFRFLDQTVQGEHHD